MLSARYTCVAVGHGEVSGAHNGVALITEQQQRRARLQIHRSSQYYRRTLTIPMLDHLITELDNRFEEAAAGIVGELAQILPSEFCSA